MFIGGDYWRLKNMFLIEVHFALYFDSSDLKRWLPKVGDPVIEVTT